MTPCKLCDGDAMAIVHIAERWLLDLIRRENPLWVERDGACPKCIEYYRDLDNTVELGRRQEDQ